MRSRPARFSSGTGLGAASLGSSRAHWRGGCGPTTKSAKGEAQGWVSCQALQPAAADQPFARGRADMARVAPTGRRPRLRAATGKRAKPTEARASPAWAGPHCAVRPMAVRGGVCPCARREIWSLTASMPRCRDALSRCRLVRRTARVTANYCNCDLSAAANGCDPMEARGRTFETCWLPCGMRWMRCAGCHPELASGGSRARLLQSKLRCFR